MGKRAFWYDIGLCFIVRGSDGNYLLYIGAIYQCELLVVGFPNGSQGQLLPYHRSSTQDGLILYKRLNRIRRTRFGALQEPVLAVAQGHAHAGVVQDELGVIGAVVDSVEVG